MSESGDGHVIEAAGGVLWRETSGRRELAVIHRARHGDWTLPKGKLDAGEGWQQAALREVREETGCEARLESFAGCVCYTVCGVPKIVLYWHMTLVGACHFQPSEEVAALVWLPVEEARRRLDHPGERALLVEEEPA